MIYHNVDRIISGGNDMTILPSTSLRNQYNEISEKCKQTGEPIYLTKNGEGDLVVMSVEAFEKHLIASTKFILSSSNSPI